MFATHTSGTTNKTFSQCFCLIVMCSEEPIFVIKSSPCHQPDVHSAEGAVDLNRYKERPFMSTAKLHLL